MFVDNKLSSFQRQLNLYGFKKIFRGEDKDCYFHPLFQKFRKELLFNIRRGLKRHEIQSYEHFMYGRKNIKNKQLLLSSEIIRERNSSSSPQSNNSSNHKPKQVSPQSSSPTLHSSGFPPTMIYPPGYYFPPGMNGMAANHLPMSMPMPMPLPAMQNPFAPYMMGYPPLPTAFPLPSPPTTTNPAAAAAMMYNSWYLQNSLLAMLHAQQQQQQQLQQEEDEQEEEEEGDDKERNPHQHKKDYHHEDKDKINNFESSSFNSSESQSPVGSSE